ncbi:MAG: response regulator [Pyrinomonadaceae bacterium]
MPLKRERVLCVADGGEDGASISSRFSPSIYDVTTATTVAAALGLAASESFALYLFAVELPNGEGVELCARVREFDPETPILFLLNSPYEVEWSRLAIAGATGYMVRGGGLDGLVNQVSRLINGSDGRGEAS